jgi:hypothetical protein
MQKYSLTSGSSSAYRETSESDASVLFVNPIIFTNPLDKSSEVYFKHDATNRCDTANPETFNSQPVDHLFYLQFMF